MKRYCLFILFCGLFSTGLSQVMQDVVYLTNGSIIRGTIMEMIPDEKVTIRTRDGNDLVFRFSEIEKIAKEMDVVPFDLYGGNFSIGFAVGGAGLFGMPLRYQLSEGFGIEAGLYLRPIFIETQAYYTTNYQIEFQPNAMGGLNFFTGKSFNFRNERIRFDGIAIRGGYGTSRSVENFFFAGGWMRESFKKTTHHRSFVFELGLGYMEQLWQPGYASITNSPFLLYWKLAWNSFVR